MNPRAIGNFLKSKFGLFIIFVAVLFSGLGLYGRHQAKEREAEKLAAQKKGPVAIGQVQVPLNQGLESGTPQQVKAAPAKASEKESAAGGIVPFHPPSVETSAVGSDGRGETRQSSKGERSHKVRMPSLLTDFKETPERAEHAESVPPERFIPFGTLLKCKLVNTLDTSNIDTPIIALLLEDVWQNGKKIVPANTLVHGFAHAGRMRDRVNASGSWRLVWQDGRELVFSGIALDREYDQDINGYGISDGSAGIRGRVMAADDMQELKMLASAALSGFAQGTQDRQQNALGTSVTGSVSNGVRQGVSEVFSLYAQRTLKDIEENGYYVRVAAGKEFYLYVLEAVDPRKASVAGVKERPIPDAAESKATASAPSPTKG